MCRMIITTYIYIHTFPFAIKSHLSYHLIFPLPIKVLGLSFLNKHFTGKIGFSCMNSINYR